MRYMALMLLMLILIPAYAIGSRPSYIYDNADVISNEYEDIIDKYLRELDERTTAEIVIYTIPSFEGHGIQKDGVEIDNIEMLANYIFNEVPLDGIRGIGKKGKDNGVLILFSLERDVNGHSMRIEVGRGLEGIITDGRAGEILDTYLVPARARYEDSNTKDFDEAFLNTVIALGDMIDKADYTNANTEDENGPWYLIFLFLIPFVGMVLWAFLGYVRLFTWENVPEDEKDNERIKDFVKSYLTLSDNAIIKKSDDRTIDIIDGDKKASIVLDGNKAYLLDSNSKELFRFKVKRKGDKTNVYFAQRRFSGTVGWVTYNGGRSDHHWSGHFSSGGGSSGGSGGGGSSGGGGASR